jgi:hypothetical protein
MSRWAHGLLLLSILLVGCSSLASPSATQPPTATLEATAAPTLGTTAAPPSALATPISSVTASAPTSPDSGCAPSDLPTLDPSYLPGHGPDIQVPIVGTGEAVQSVDDISGLGFTPRLPSDPPAGLQIRLILIDQAGASNPAPSPGSNRGFRVYYANQTIADDTTLVSLLVSGGVFLHENASTGAFDDSNVKQLLGSRANPVRVGTSNGYLVWSDPVDESKQRYFTVFWSDSGVDYEIRAGLSNPDDVVNFARSIACQ